VPEFPSEQTLEEDGITSVWNSLKSRFLQSTEVDPAPEDSETPNEGEQTTKDQDKKSWLMKTMEGLGYSFLFIFLSEIGDKTFLFVVLYATRMNGVKLLVISSIALCGMHVSGVAVGGLFQYIFTPFWLKLITVVSFFVLGVALIVMGIMEKEEEEDFDTKMREIEMEMLSEKSRKLSKGASLREVEEDDEENSELMNGDHRPVKSESTNPFSAFFRFCMRNEPLKIIVTIICTEMGDRSQISAVALAANYKFWIVALAGSIGHIFALILAILFGKAVSDYTTEK
jgi:putative Ca2+/H+ antiporter (TMEM165/GDT1 family)